MGSRVPIRGMIDMTNAKDTNGSQTEKHSGLDRDAIHNILSNSRRRAVIRILDEHGELEKGELAKRIAADEFGKAIENITSEERKRIYISLHQHHIDEMQDAGVIDSNGTIQLTDRADQLLWHLEQPKSFVEHLKAALKSLF